MNRKMVEIGSSSSVSIHTTGLQGGDSSHGGRHVLTLEMESGHLDVEVQALGALRPRKIEGLSLLRMTLGGDWELQALYGMLKVGLEELEKQIVELHGEEALKEMEHRVRQSIEEFDEMQRSDVREMKEEGLSVSQIAKKLGLSVQEVRDYCKD